MKKNSFSFHLSPVINTNNHNHLPPDKSHSMHKRLFLPRTHIKRTQKKPKTKRNKKEEEGFFVLMA